MRTSVCCFDHELWGVNIVVRADEFTALGVTESLEKFHRGMAEHFAISHSVLAGTRKGSNANFDMLAWASRG